MAGQNRKSKVEGDTLGFMNHDPVLGALPDPAMGCPISKASKGNPIAPVQNSNVEEDRNHEMVEGGPSICRDGDPPPLLITVSDDIPLEAAPSPNLPEAAHKVYDESPERKLAPVQAVSSEWAADLHCSDHLKTGPMRSYADVVSNAKELDVNAKSKNVPSDTTKKFAGAKTSFNKSFYDCGASCKLGQISEIKGCKVVSFSAEELEELATPFEFTLVGKFSHGFPTMKILKSIMGNLNLKGSFSIALLEHKYVLIRLSCEEDYTRLWSRQVWFMAGFPMRILKWTPDFDPLVESPFAPVWVLFPYLPVHLFDKRSLFQIASVLGKPLRIDSATAELTRPSTPRVCIEIDVTQASLPEIEIRLGGKIRIQPVEYENLPSYCSFCKHLGHNMKSCKSFNKPSSSKFDNASLDRPPQKIEVSAAAREDQICQISPPVTAGSASSGSKLGSKGSIISTTERVDVRKIREDIFKSYELFEIVSDPESGTIEFPRYMPYAYDTKQCFSEGDHPHRLSPAIVPPKKTTKKKKKKKKDLGKEKVIETQNDNTVDEWLEANNRVSESRTSKDDEGFIQVVRKNKKIKE